MLTAGRDVSKEDVVKQRGHIILYSTRATVRVLLLFYNIILCGLALNAWIVVGHQCINLGVLE